MNVLARLWTWLRRLFTRRRAVLRTVVVDELPVRLEPKLVYLVGEGDQLWCAALLCPCGCAAVIQLNLVASTRPVWCVHRHSHTDRVTLRPSIWRTQGCRSHFFLRDGCIEWCTAQSVHA